MNARCRRRLKDSARLSTCQSLFNREEKPDGFRRKSFATTHRGTRDRDLAGNALRVRRGSWAFHDQRTPGLGQLHKLTDAIAEHNKITGYTSLYKVGPKIYRAGVSVAEAPKNLPAGAETTRFKGGKYSQFVLTGRFADLPDASRRVFEIVAEKKIPLRDDFCIEHYVTDPRETPEDRNVIQIAVPTA